MFVDLLGGDGSDHTGVSVTWDVADVLIRTGWSINGHRGLLTAGKLSGVDAEFFRHEAVWEHARVLECDRDISVGRDLKRSWIEGNVDGIKFNRRCTGSSSTGRTAGRSTAVGTWARLRTGIRSGNRRHASASRRRYFR